MKLNTMLRTSMLLVLIAGVDARADEGKACSNETLKGSYGGAFSGTRPAPFVAPGGPGYAGQIEKGMLWVFDGKGKYTQVIIGRGSISGWAGDQAASGSYTVMPDCTGSIVPALPPGAPPTLVRMVIVDGGSEFRTIVVSPQTTNLTGHHRKVN